MNKYRTKSQILQNLDNIPIGELDLELLFSDVATPLNVYHQGQYSSHIANLYTTAISEFAYPAVDKRPPISALNEMQERDPVVSQCIALKALRTVQSFGNYTHPKKEIENFINSNLDTLNKSFKHTLFKIISSTILYGFCIAEFTVTSKARGYRGQWRLENLNVLDPERIIRILGKKGRIETIEYDNGHGIYIKIPYKKCIHIINNSGATFNEREVWGIGDGIIALNYYTLKRIVLTHLAVATKNNSTGIIHAKTSNTGRTILVDSKMNPLKDSNGKPVEVTKQIALNYQLQDIYKKDYIVTDLDVELNRIQTQNDERFWDYILNYIDRAIQRAFGVPVGIFDSGISGTTNVGLSQNFKSVFDTTIYALTTLIKEELISKIVKRLLYFNFPFEWFKNNYGEFVFDAEEDQTTINSRLSTISSLIASGILDQNDTEVIGLIRKNLGLPALNETAKAEKQQDAIAAQISKEIQNQLTQLQLQMQVQQVQLQDQQLQMQEQQLQNPQPQDPSQQQASSNNNSNSNSSNSNSNSNQEQETDYPASGA
jgi:hypothetical protein